MTTRRNALRLAAPCAIWMAASAPGAHSGTLHVPAQYPTIQAALNAAQSGDTILVADGVYTGPGNKGLFFPQPAAITLRSANGPENCILDLQGSGVAFFLVADEPPETVIRGFTVRNGSGSNGGAAFLHHDCDATFVDCVFTGNNASIGGAVYTENDTSATFLDCAFEGNTANMGGAVFVAGGSDPTFVNCRITGNSAGADGGGVHMATFGTTPRLLGCLVADNVAGGRGGGIFAGSGSPAVAGCTVAGNVAAVAGGGIAARGPGSLAVENAILWGDSSPLGAEIALLADPNFGAASATLRFSDLQGGAAAAHLDPGASLVLGPGMLDADPLFVASTTGDYRLAGGSPAIDAGDPLTVVPANQPYDVIGFGHPRLDDGDFDGIEVIDMGATEFGGLIGNQTVPVGGAVSMTLWGRPFASYFLFLGVPGGPFGLGPIGTMFLAPPPLILVGSGALPASGQAAVLNATAPASAAGATVGFQAATLGPGPAPGPHATNLETMRIE